MNRVRILRWLLVPMVLASFVSVRGAAAAQSVDWSGTTDPQGLPLAFTITQQGPQAVISYMEFQFDLTCEIDGLRIGLDTAYFGFDVPIVNNRFSFSWRTSDEVLQWDGSFDSPIHASGTVQDALPALTRNIVAERCPSGLQSFTAHPSGGGSASPRAVDVRIVHTKDVNGVHTTVSRD